MYSEHPSSWSSVLSLFSRTLKVAVLASGSRGNCTYIGDGHAGVLVDCGVSTKQILARLEQLDMKDAPIDGVPVSYTHLTLPTIQPV